MPIVIVILAMMNVMMRRAVHEPVLDQTVAVVDGRAPKLDERVHEHVLWAKLSASAEHRKTHRKREG